MAEGLRATRAAGRWLACLCALAGGTGCYTVNQSLEVDLRSTDDVQVAVSRNRAAPLILKDADDVVPLSRSRDDVVLGSGSGYSALSNNKPGTVVTGFEGAAPKVLPTEGGLFVWRRALPADDIGLGVSDRELSEADILVRDRRIEVSASTPLRNVREARVVTRWRHRYGLVLPVLAGIGGGLLVTGAGLGLYGLGQEGFGLAHDPPDQQRLAQTGVLSAVAVTGVALLGYCVASVALVTASPFVDPVRIPEEPARRRRRTKR